MAEKYYCTNCGHELVSELKVDYLDPEGEEIVVSPSGKVGVCPACNMASVTTKETQESPFDESVPEGQPVDVEPERPEDQVPAGG